MWADIETTADLLNFTVVADVAANLIKDSGEEPLSIGVSGSWGVGKSSLVKMIQASLKRMDDENKFIFLEFNAWLYQGYEDARLALLQSVADVLLAEAEQRKTYIDQAKDFIKRIKWLKLVRFLTPIAQGVIGGSVGGPIGALGGALVGFMQTRDLHTAEKVEKEAKEVMPLLQPLIGDKEDASLPKEIEGLRQAFATILEGLGIRLVVVVDDLDRCLPQTAISTLEAMRLLLFMPRSSFIIAADEAMIRSAVKAHFEQVDINDSLITNYFDKLIQVPLRVPRLGSNEVKAYISLLLGDLARRRGQLTDEQFENAKIEILEVLKKPWEGGVTLAKLNGAFDSSNIKSSNLDIADQLANFLTTADDIAGNPRLIKRFLNNLMIRDSIAKAQNMTIEFEALVKIQLFERCASASAFDYLIQIVNESGDGKPELLITLESKIEMGEELELPAPWQDDFVKKWIAMPPKLGQIDLRPLLYLSQDRALSINASEELSKDGAILLSALIASKSLMQPLVNRIRTAGEFEANIILKRLIKHVRSEQFSKDSISSCLNVTSAFPQFNSQVLNLLRDMPPAKRTAPLVPLLRNESWARQLLAEWSSDGNSSQTVVRAISQL